MAIKGENQMKLYIDMKEGYTFHELTIDYGDFKKVIPILSLHSTQVDLMQSVFECINDTTDKTMRSPHT